MHHYKSLAAVAEDMVKSVVVVLAVEQVERALAQQEAVEAHHNLLVVLQEEDHTVLELSPQVIKYLVALLLIELEYTHHLEEVVDTMVVVQVHLITTQVVQVAVDLDTSSPTQV